MRSALALLSLCLSLSGCYLFHERPRVGASADGGSGTGPDAATGPDAGDPPPPPPPPPRCALAPVMERFIASYPDGSMHAPDLFLAGDQLGVLMFQSDTIRHPEIVLSHTDLHLEEVSAPRRVGEESHGWGEAAWNGERVGVCWDGDPDGAGALRFREIDGLDGALGPRADFGTETGPCTELVYAHGVYAMTYRSENFDVDPVQVETMLALVAETGEPIAEPMAMARGDYPGRTPSLVATEDGFLALVYEDAGLRMLGVDPRGEVTRDRTIPLPVGYTAVALRDDRLGLVSLEGPSDTRALVFRIASLDGRVLFERPIEGGAPTTAYPRVAARPEGWALLWAEGYRPSEREIILSLDPDGVPLAARRTLYDGAHSGYGGPSVLSVDDTLYVGISHEGTEPPMGREGTYVQRWECGAPPEDLCRAQDARAADCDGERVWGFRWTGDRCAPVVGCESDCVGEDCMSLSRTEVACESDRIECPAIECPATTARLAQLCAPAQTPSMTSRVLDVAIWGDGCPCAPRPRCRVEVSGERELRLSFEQCADPTPDCACDPEPVRWPITCVLPPLSPGEWVLRGDGAEPISMTVTAPWETPEGETVCAAGL